MSAIHQMYCTHCTHGSSALQRCQGELASRMLGYSVRAGSLEGDALKQAYRQVERYLSYHLPQDTPAGQKLQLTAATAPRRLFFLPGAGSWQVIGHVAYRQRDTEGRPGSYFAHLLCRETASQGEPWTLLDALRLWNAPGWVTEDRDELNHTLPAVDALESILEGADARIDDQALLAFLRGDNRPFGSHLPERWLDLVAAKRVEILQAMLASLLTIGTTRRQALLVAVEPEAAALLFYGVGRLLPSGKLRRGVSMSTFEASTDRLTTVLAATTFADPATTEFNTDALRGRGISINTFANFCCAQASPSMYAESVIQRMLDEGLDGVDQYLAMIAAAGPERIEALEDFAKTERAVATLFRSAGGAGEIWNRDAALTTFARTLTRKHLEGFDGAEAAFAGLCGGASHTTILDLAATQAPGGPADRGIRFFLERLPAEKTASFAASQHVDDCWKIELIGSRIAATGKMPAGCEWVFSEPGRQAPLDSARGKAIALGVMARLSANSSVALLSSLDSERRQTAVDRLLEVCATHEAQWPVFAETVRRLDAGSLVAAWRRLGERLFEVPESVGGAVSSRLQEILDALHETPSEFSQRLEFLQAGRRWLGDPDCENRLAAWCRCRDAMVKLASVKDPGSGWTQWTAAGRQEPAAQQMAEAVLEALPPSRLEDDRQGTAKLERMRAIGKHVADGESFLPSDHWQNEALWKKIGWRIEMGSWPSAPLRKMVRGPADRQRMWIAVAIAAAVVLCVLAVIGLANIGTGPGDSDSLVVERGELPNRLETQSGADTNVAEPKSNAQDGLSDGALANEPPAEEPGTSAPEPGPPPLASQSSNNSESDTSAETPVRSETAIFAVRGDFAATMTPVAGLARPNVAMVALEVRGVDGDSFPDWLTEQFAVGAVVREHSDLRPVRTLDFSDLRVRNKAELGDGVSKVLVQFRFSRKPHDPAEGKPVIQATSISWAEVPIQPAQRYDIRFVLSPAAVDELKRLANVER